LLSKITFLDSNELQSLYKELYMVLTKEEISRLIIHTTDPSKSMEATNCIFGEYMSVKIRWKDHEILHLKNVTYSIIYESLLQNIENNNVKLTPALQLLIDELYLGIDGIGTDISRFLKNSEDIRIFCNLLQRAITEVQFQFIEPYKHDIVNRLNNFKDFLLNLKLED
jgi:hypothetical protein